MKSISNLLGILVGASILIFVSCNGDGIKTPKPRMYPRVFFPERSYTKYDTSHCPFVFKYASYNKILRDSFIFEGKPVSDCWFDINSHDLNASIHCSYYEVNSQKTLSKLIEEAFKIASNHNTKANFRKEDVILNSYGVKGLMFHIDGPVASPIQFYLTDEKHHFFRASLYFNSRVNPDSTAIVLDFIKPDIDSIIANFQWKKK